MIDNQAESPRPPIRRSAIVAAFLFVVTLLAAGGSIYWSSRGARIEGEPPGAVLLVLPLDEQDTEPSDAIGGLITEELVDAFRRSAPSKINVIAYESAIRLRDDDGSPASTAERVGATHAVAGRVERTGERIRLTLQLFRVADGRPIWAKTLVTNEPGLERTEAAVVDGIATTLLGPDADVRGTTVRAVDADARAAWRDARRQLRARGPDSLNRGLETLSEATRLDPEFPLAWGAIARASIEAPDASQRIGTIKRAIQKALELDPRLADTWTDLGIVSLYYDWNWAAAGQALDRSNAVEASMPRALSVLAAWNSSLGRFETAESLLRRALPLDPLSPSLHMNLGLNAFRARRWSEALKEFEIATLIDPNGQAAHDSIFDCLVEEGDLDAAREIALDVLRRRRASESAIAAIETASSDNAVRLYLEWNVARAHLALERGDQVEATLGVLLARLGRREEALDWLGRAFERRSPYMPFLAVDPHLDSLRGDPRFERLVERVGIPVERPAGRAFDDRTGSE